MNARTSGTCPLRWFFLSLTAILAGCAPLHKNVRITSDPAGATAEIAGATNGITPFSKTLEFPDNHAYSVTVSKPGFKAASLSIAYQPATQSVYHVTLQREATVALELVSYEPVETTTGVKLRLINSISRAYLETIERSANVAAVTKVTDNQDDKIYIGALTLSPVDDSLVYCLFFKDGNIYISNLEKISIGSFAKTKVTTGRYFDFFPTFLPDGQSIIFSSNRTTENPILWRVRVNGAGGIERITNTQAEDFAPSVFPDGKIIAYSSNLPGADESQIWHIPTAGGLSTQLREGHAGTISPDGKTILYVRTDKRASQEQKRPIRQIWKMNIDGTGETRLTQDPRYDMIHPQWSPDGKRIVFASDEGRDSENQNNYDIWMMSADGSNPTQLTTNGSRDDNPCWDRTGKKIYFRSNRGGHWNIWSFEPLLNK